MTAPRAIVVSIRKSGTHLIKQAVTAMGYSVTGQIAETTKDSSRGGHVLDQPTVFRILRMVYDEQEMAEITTSTDRALLDLAVRRAQDALLNCWRIRLGLPAGRAASADELTMQLTARTLTRTAARRFHHTPAGVCWFLHELDLDLIDQAFLEEWMELDAPKIVLNHRDPRDTLLSMVEFLATRSPAELAGLPEHQLYGEIIKSLSTTADRLAFALRDPCFPGGDAFARMLWLRNHPRVCTVSFEELIGPSGGGTTAAQNAAMTRLVDFLDCDQDPLAISQKLFDPDAYTFSRGEVGRWRHHFTAEHIRLFQERYGDLAAVYGYDS